MECLACGDCCKRMSPLSPDTDELNKAECPMLEMHGDIAHCSCYTSSPSECKAHDFPARFCPIGMSVLNLETSEDVQKRCYNIYLDRGGTPI